MTVNTLQDIDICNRSQIILGAPPINSIETPTTDPEAIYATLYPMSLDSVLARYDWKCANPERQLAVNADKTPVVGMARAHKLPSDLIAGPHAVYGDNSVHPVHDWVNAEDHIHSNYEIVRITYRARPAVSIMPAYLLDVIVHDLAMRAAKPITDNTALGEEMRIRAYGPADMNGNGGLFAVARSIEAKSRPIQSLFRNGDPLSSTRW